MPSHHPILYCSAATIVALPLLLSDPFNGIRIVAAAGKDRLREYIEEIFDPALIELGYYTEENAEQWLDINKFMRWLGLQAQKSPARPVAPRPTVNSHPVPHLHNSQLPPSSPIPGTSSPLVTTTKSTREPQSSSPIHVADSDDEDLITAPLLPPRRLRLRLHRRLNPQRQTSQQDNSEGGGRMLEITKQFRVQEIRDINKLPSCWSIPRPDEGESFAYRLNFTQDSREWLDSKNESLSMAAIIKSEDQDSWGGGSAGSKKKATKVTALDGALCQVASHICQGVFVCSELDTSLLDGHERYEPDDEQMRELFDAERDVNVRETSSMAIRAAAFYKEIHTKKCPHVDATGVQCTGLPVYRKLKEMNLDGKNSFIGCQNYRAGEARTHRFITIHRDVKEEYIRELLTNGGTFKSGVGLDPQSAVCARVLPPRSGGKGSQLCPYTHIDPNSRQVIQGKIIHRPCEATIRIFSPVDRSDRRAIIHLTGNSRQGRDTYVEAINAAGVTGLTVLKCDSAQSTSKIFGGEIPAVLDPALANPRIKRKLIQGVKKIENPHGLGIEGVLAWQKQMQSLPHEKQYVWNVTSENGEEMIITMLPYLANRIHFAKASLHDNTYSRVHGTWKEWEVVIWEYRFDWRVTIGQIYSQHETLAVFMKMWPGLWETIAHITKTEVKFKFIDGEGLQAILVDGNKPQANALGAYLTQDELDVFVQWCKDSEYKVVRDWIADKDSVPWFFPSINGFLSKISEEDWYLTPGDTNLNESAHPYTNQHTGTNLTILEAVQSGYRLDLQMEAKLKAMESSSRTELENIDDEISRSTALTKELREKKKELKAVSGVTKTKRKGEKQKTRLPDENEFAGLSESEGEPEFSQHPTTEHLAPALYLPG
ncbi:hypothetical protein B0H11DRAFT_1911939 [Mycena galericulata]|nr:hypothetical protein B0H11DRAFT_1911939 [Mycena galericulata]